MSLLRDPFDDAVAGPLFGKFQTPGAAVVEADGHLSVQLPAGGDGDSGSYRSTYLYDLTDGEFATTVTQTGGAFTYLGIDNGAGVTAHVESGNGGGLLHAIIDYDGTGQNYQASIPYIPQQHQHWRIRAQDGTLYWETSAERVVWAELWSEPVTFPLDHVTGVLAAGGAFATASEARFDTVNDGDLAGRFCPTGSLVDSFDTGEFFPNWESLSDASCTIARGGGNLAMSFTGAGPSFCGIDSRHLFDLRDSEVVLDAALVPQQPGFAAYLTLSRVGDDDTRVEINRGSDLVFRQTVDGAEVGTGSTPYSAVNHRYWRLRESDGTIFWDTSPDGSSWTTQGEASAMFDLGQLQISAGTGYFGDGAPIIARFGGVNAVSANAYTQGPIDLAAGE